MAKKKTTKEVVVETTQVIEPIQVKTVESIVEPQVSMEDFTMIEKYQQDIAKFGADLQAWTARYQWYAERYQSIVQQYLAFFGHMTPKQEQAKSQERKED